MQGLSCTWPREACVDPNYWHGFAWFRVINTPFRVLLEFHAPLWQAYCLFLNFLRNNLGMQRVQNFNSNFNLLRVYQTRFFWCILTNVWTGEPISNKLWYLLSIIFIFWSRMCYRLLSLQIIVTSLNSNGQFFALYFHMCTFDF